MPLRVPNAADYQLRLENGIRLTKMVCDRHDPNQAPILTIRQFYCLPKELKAKILALISGASRTASGEDVRWEDLKFRRKDELSFKFYDPNFEIDAIKVLYRTLKRNQGTVIASSLIVCNCIPQDLIKSMNKRRDRFNQIQK